MSSMGELPFPVAASCKHSLAWTELTMKATKLHAVLNITPSVPDLAARGYRGTL